MSLFRVLPGLLMLMPALCLPAGGARSPYPSPEEQIHRKLTAAREQAGRNGLERRDDLDEVARSRAREIAARPPESRLRGATPIEHILEENGVLYCRAVERLILLKNIEPVSGVMEKWQGQSDAWTTYTSSELDAAGYGTARAEDGWVVFVAVMIRGLVLRDSPEERKAMEQEVLDRINAIREDRRLPELRLRKDLADTARAHSRDMAARDYFSHADLTGSQPAGRVRAAGIRFRGVAENLTMNNNPDTPAEQAVRDWMDSPGHRRNILDGAFLETGVGMAVSDDGRYYFTQLFLIP